MARGVGGRGRRWRRARGAGAEAPSGGRAASEPSLLAGLPASAPMDVVSTRAWLGTVEGHHPSTCQRLELGDPSSCSFQP